MLETKNQKTELNCLCRKLIELLNQQSLVFKGMTVSKLTLLRNIPKRTFRVMRIIISSLKLDISKKEFMKATKSLKTSKITLNS
jgi:hypothetical protein